MIKDLSVMIGGKAGDGVLFTGNVLARLLKRHGWEVVTGRDFPSNIRGEPTRYTVRASLNENYGPGDLVNILLAFDCEAVLDNLPLMAAGGIVLCDGEVVVKPPKDQAEGKTFHKFPLRSMAKEEFGHEIFKNMIALGALNFLLDLKTGLFEEVMTEMFLKQKGEEVVRKNIQAAAYGYEKAREITLETERHPLARKQDGERLLLSGDEAIAFGALAAGCRFFAAYPICPASEISHWLARHMPQFNGVVIQTEDELAALNMALGAAYAGARAMTATSGPGASLMMEAFSLAGMAEIPIVIAHIQRLGPATGIPTKTQQGDILQWVFGSHGEFARIILVPGTLSECFELTTEAFNLAEKYQCPVVLLAELDMGQDYRTAPRFDLSRVKIDRGKLLTQEKLLGIQSFKRYEVTFDGISARALPFSRKGLHLVESLEHDEYGYRDESEENRMRMMEKRMKKLKKASKDFPRAKVWGPRKAAAGLITIGSTLGPVLEAAAELREKHLQAKCLQLRTLWPFPVHAVKRFLDECDRVFVIENNCSAELATLIRSQVSPIPEMVSILRCGTRSFRPREVIERVEKAVR